MQGFREKYRSEARMIFSETARPGLAVRKRRTLILPGSFFGSVSQTIPFCLIIFLHIFISYSIYGRAAHVDGSAIYAFCKSMPEMEAHDALFQKIRPLIMANSRAAATMMQAIL